MRNFPVVLVGTSYWTGLLDWIRGTLIASGAIDDEDLALLQLTDDPDEVVRIVRAFNTGSAGDVESAPPPRG